MIAVKISVMKIGKMCLKKNDREEQLDQELARRMKLLQAKSIFLLDIYPLV